MIAIAIVIVGAALYMDAYNRGDHVGQLRVKVERDLRILHAEISAIFRSDLENAHSLADAIAVEPMISTSKLDAMVDKIIKRNPHFVTVGFAPDFKLSSIRPAKSVQGETLAMIQAEVTRLASGNEGPAPSSITAFTEGLLILHLPVYIDAARTKTWGSVVIITDEKESYRNSSLAHSGAYSTQRGPLDYLSISMREGDGRASVITGAALSDADAPLTRKFAPEFGNWEISAAPRAGWDSTPDDQLPYRLTLALVAGILIASVVTASVLIRERNRNISALRAREIKLLELSGRFELAMSSANIGIWEVAKGKRVFWDRRAAAIHGFNESRYQDQDRVDEWKQAIHPEDLKEAANHLLGRGEANANGTFESSYRVVQADGSVRYLRAVGMCADPANPEAKITGIVWDVTADALARQTLRHAKDTSEIKNAEMELALEELSSRENELSELSHKFDLALASYNCGIWEGDPLNGGAVWDARMHQLYGLEFKNNGVVTEEEWLNCLYVDDRKAALKEARATVNKDLPFQSIQRIALADGSFRFVRSVGQVHVGNDGKNKIIGIAFDITSDILMTEELKLAKEDADIRNLELETAKNRIEFNALHDPLTGLANRRKFDMELDRVSLDSLTSGQKFSILHLDLDRFKEINDTLGHAAGDAMLVNAADILMACVSDSDLVARIGGDEFVILTRGAATSAQLSSLCQQIISEMNKPVDFEGFACRCGVSIGIAQAHGTNIDARKILINADIALYEAKEKGRNGFEFFTQELQANIINSKRMSDEILEGLDRDEFTVWYQPQFDAKSMDMIGAEALVRWDHPERGILNSAHFLKIAEDINVMGRIDQLVLEKTLRDKMLLAAKGINIPKIAVNVSSKRLHDETLIFSLENLPLRPGEICFELVESIFLDESDEIVTENIKRIKALGIDIELDDFGTGHTSLVSLLKLKPKRLKIDRQLVMPILTSPQELALVRSILDIARSLGVETIAEGVETPAHGELLCKLGCDMLQGYAFAKPLPLDELMQFATDKPWRQAS